MKKTTLIVSTLLVAGIGLGSSILLRGQPGQPSPKTRGAWVYKTDDPSKMARDVETIVVATFIGSHPGRVVPSSTGESSLSFELNDFTVEDVVKGAIGRGPMTIERVAVSSSPDGPIAIDYDGGPYVPGTRYLLFVNQQPESSFYYLVNDEGRYAVSDQRTLIASGDGAVAAALDGKSLSDALTFVRAAARVR